MIPYDSDNRRNIGYLMALERGLDFVISIDDDNFCMPGQDFFQEHRVVCAGEQELLQRDSLSGWLNICESLQMEPPARVFPRGYPYAQRQRTAVISDTACRGSVSINAGLWLLDPDLDALTWLSGKIQAREFRGPSYVLGERTWSPINTQNTALRRDAIASYYFVKMGAAFDGVIIDRYGDIFSGYFSQACAKHLGHRIRVGSPVAEHRRNSHDYLRDARKEWGCIAVLEDLLTWLPEAQLEGATYAETYLALSHLLEDFVEGATGFIWNDGVRAYFHQMAFYMRAWSKACRRWT
jgi:hypothetical protein